MRGVVKFIIIKLTARLLANILEVAIVYFIATKLYRLVRWGVQGTYRIASAATVASQRAVKKTRKVKMILPPPTHTLEQLPLGSPGESEVSEVEEDADPLPVQSSVQA